jgi:hypothetical protein
MSISGRFERFHVSYIRDPRRGIVFVSDSLVALVVEYNKHDGNTKIGRSGVYYGLNHGGRYKGLEVGRSSTDVFHAQPGDTVVLVNASS